MRRPDREFSGPAEIEEMLRSAELCFLSMVDDGKPYVVPLAFGYADGALYFHSAPEGRKMQILRKNPEVSFCVVAHYTLVRAPRACYWTARYRSVTGTGTAEFITDRRGMEDGLAILMNSYTGDEYDFSGEDLDGVAVIRVKIGTVAGKSSWEDGS